MFWPICPVPYVCFLRQTHHIGSGNRFRLLSANWQRGARFIFALDATGPVFSFPSVRNAQLREANGVWVFFPISAILLTVVKGLYLKRAILRNLTTDISA